MPRPVNATLLRGAALSLLLVACGDMPSAPDLEPSFSPGGNAAAAKQCQKGNFANVYRTDGTPFATVGDCIGYAAVGGELVTRRITSVGHVWFVGCNDLTFGYEIDGVRTDLQTRSAGCGQYTNGVVHQIPHLSHQYVRLYLRDNTCAGWIFYEDGNRADVTPQGDALRVRIMDAGGLCEFPPDVPREVGGALGIPFYGNLTTWRRTDDG